MQHVEIWHVLLDAGCGREARFLQRFEGKAKRLIGVDIVEFHKNGAGNTLELLNNDLRDIKLPDKSIDIVISRSVLEHLEKPLSVYMEIFRILKEGGYFSFLTPNLGHYSALICKLIPNKFHSGVVLRTEGRKEEDTFPTYYRSNTFPTINNLAQRAGFQLISFKHLGQYPSYFAFNPILFLIATGYEKLIDKFHALRYLRGWLLVVLKREGDVSP